MDPLPLNSLPNELILAIASRLPGRDIARLMRTTHHLHALLLPALHATIPANADDILLWGATYSDPHAVHLALAHNANPNALTPARETALWIATRNNCLPIIDALLARPATGLEFPHPDTRLQKRHLAGVVAHGTTAVARRLLARGVLVYHTGEARSPILEAVLRNDEAMIALLLDTRSGWRSHPMAHVNSKVLMDATAAGIMTVAMVELFLKWSSEVLDVEGEGLYGVVKIDLGFKGYDRILAFLQHYGVPYEIVGGGGEVPAAAAA